jgi:porin
MQVRFPSVQCLPITLLMLSLCAFPARSQTHSGANPPPGFGGPSSASGQLSSDREQRASKPVAARSGGWADLKQSLSQSAGLTFGGDISFMGQTASTGSPETDAASAVLRLYGTWVLIGRGSPDQGALHFKLESRNSLGDLIPPQDLGPTLGYAGLTSVGFSDAGLILTNLFWQQSFDNDRFAVVAGIVDVTDFLDVYGLVSPWTGFSNLAFSTNPTIPAPNQGLGLAARWRIADHYYVVAGLADANALPNDPAGSISNLFATGETFKHLEFGWYDTWDTRFSDNVHLSVWQIDDRVAAGVEGGWGAAVSASRTLAERWVPFFRAGYADGGGALLDRSVSIGTGYSLFDGRDQLGVGLNWGKAPENSKTKTDRDQYTTEVFYRFQPTPNLQITPNLQYLLNPSYAPDLESVWVAGLRVRVVF